MLRKANDSDPFGSSLWILTLAALVYNIKRVTNILGVATMATAVAA